MATEKPPSPTFSDEEALKALGSIAWMLYHHARPEMQKLAMNYAEKHNVDGALRLGGSALLKRRETGVERITHSATIGGGKLYKLPAPARHHDVFAVMREAGFTRWGSERTGFYTSDGRYVDRDEAWNIAVAAGQLNDRSPTDGRGGTLYSEDVW